MPKKEASRKTKERWIKDYPELFICDTGGMECKVCKIKLLAVSKTHVTRHVLTKQHHDALKGRDKDKQERFNLDLIKFMVGCNIPWNQLNNPVFREFIEKCMKGQYTQVELPSESRLRQAYLPKAAEEVVQAIRCELNGKNIWVSVDDTTNACGKHVSHVLVGALDELSANRGHLISSRELDHTNADSIATLVQESLQILWGPNLDEHKDQFVLFITDGAGYMKAAGRILQRTFNCLHVTCFAHALHRIAEKIRGCYPSVDKLISNVKKVFRKAPARTKLFREILPGIPLPPEPIVTRWGTWLEAARYYYIHFSNIQQVLERLDPNESVAIANAQEIVRDPTVANNLQEIHNNYSRIPHAIQQLEHRPSTDTFTITDALNVIYDLRQYIAQLSGDCASEVKQKLDHVLASNPGFLTLEHIYKLLQKREVDFAIPGLNTSALCKYRVFRYAPTSVDVERSFSQYKWIFSARRRSLTASNMEQLLRIYFYNSPIT